MVLRTLCMFGRKRKKRKTKSGHKPNRRRYRLRNWWRKRVEE